MKEIKSIIKAYDSIDWSAEKAALATVVRVEGSSYRRTGARMLVMDTGNWVGGISGGCLEGDALKRAKLAIYKAEPTLITYDTSTDDEHQIGVGLGCNGIIDVLFCPLDFSNKTNAVEILKSCISNSFNANTIVTITGSEGEWGDVKKGFAFLYLGLESLSDFGNNGAEIQRKIMKQLEIGHSAPKTLSVSETKSINFFIEIIPPEIHLLLFGHQYDVFPLTKIIKEIGWRVTIVANPLKVNTTISALADEVLPAEDFENLLIHANTAIILMAHDFKTDKNNLLKALKTNVKYIGLLGPKVRSEKMFKELDQEGIMITESDLDRIYAPVGLDIGAVTPEEIALSLVAEIRAVFSNRNGKSLRLREEPIHDRNL